MSGLDECYSAAPCCDLHDRGDETHAERVVVVQTDGMSIQVRRANGVRHWVPFWVWREGNEVRDEGDEGLLVVERSWAVAEGWL